VPDQFPNEEGGTTLATPLIAMTAMTNAIRVLYGMGKAVETASAAVVATNQFIDRHIADLKRSDNPTIASTGRVLEAAKFGFGLGYASSIAIIATGQLLLGNSLNALGTVASGLILTNPVAMTCAAVGAICYGWSALSDKEREAILDRLSVGLEMGIELIKALVDFVIRKTREFLSSKQLAEFKEFIKTQAAQFGKTLYDVTRAMSDMVRGAAEKAGDLAGQAADLTSAAAKKTAGLASSAAGKVADTASDMANVVAGKFRTQEVVALPIAPTSFTPQALKRWESIPADASRRLLRSVWCAHCSKETTITNFTGRIQRGDLILTGQCNKCHGKVVRLIEGS